MKGIRYCMIKLRLDINFRLFLGSDISSFLLIHFHCIPSDQQLPKLKILYSVKYVMWVSRDGVNHKR